MVNLLGHQTITISLTSDLVPKQNKTKLNNINKYI